MSSAATLLSLPDELIATILGLSGLIGTISATCACRRLRKISSTKNEMIWPLVCQIERVSPHEPTKSHIKETYVLYLDVIA
jgi:hypothetical protein